MLQLLFIMMVKGETQISILEEIGIRIMSSTDQTNMLIAVLIKNYYYYEIAFYAMA